MTDNVTLMKERYEALNKAGINTTSAKLMFGIIRVLTKKAGPKLQENGYTGLAITATVNADGTMKPLVTVYKANGEKTIIPLVGDDIEEAEVETIKQIEENDKG